MAAVGNWQLGYLSILNIYKHTTQASTWTCNLTAAVADCQVIYKQNTV